MDDGTVHLRTGEALARIGIRAKISDNGMMTELFLLCLKSAGRRAVKAANKTNVESAENAT